MSNFCSKGEGISCQLFVRRREPHVKFLFEERRDLLSTVFSKGEGISCHFFSEEGKGEGISCQFSFVGAEDFVNFFFRRGRGSHVNCSKGEGIM